MGCLQLALLLHNHFSNSRGRRVGDADRDVSPSVSAASIGAFYTLQSTEKAAVSFHSLTQLRRRFHSLCPSATQRCFAHRCRPALLLITAAAAVAIAAPVVPMALQWPRDNIAAYSTGAATNETVEAFGRRSAQLDGALHCSETSAALRKSMLWSKRRREESLDLPPPPLVRCTASYSSSDMQCHGSGKMNRSLGAFCVKQFAMPSPTSYRGQHSSYRVYSSLATSSTSKTSGETSGSDGNQRTASASCNCRCTTTPGGGMPSLLGPILKRLEAAEEGPPSHTSVSLLPLSTTSTAVPYIPLLYRAGFRTRRQDSSRSQDRVDASGTVVPPLLQQHAALQSSHDPPCAADEVVGNLADDELDTLLLGGTPDLMAAASEKEGRVADKDSTLPTRRSVSASKPCLDPLEWLSQAEDAPLLDADMLKDCTPNVQYSFCMNGSAQRETEEEEHGPLYAAATETDASEALAASIHRLSAARTTSAPTTANASDGPTDVEDGKGGHDAAALASSQLPSDALIYNVFSRRVVKASSPSVRTLALMGIGVSAENRQLHVADAETLNQLAHHLRERHVSWPQAWSRGSLYTQVGRLLSDSAIADPATRVEQLLRLQYNHSSRRRHETGLVAVGNISNGGDISDDPSVMASPEYMERENSRLLTVQDLNEEQQAVVQFVLRGYHTYIGGGAGTGKSVLLRLLRKCLIKEGLTVAMTGTTGVAGSHISGCTFHHCFGVNLHGEFTRLKELSAYDVIIIDEVSMMPLELFESFERQLRRANRIDLPFGGVQVILSGDFMQLGAISSLPLITSPLFRRHFAMLKLQTVVRQEKNAVFAAQLQQLRRGLVPRSLSETIHFTSREELVAQQSTEAALRSAQTAQLQLLCCKDFSDTRATASLSPPPPDTAAAPPFVSDAVNLLPTNEEVYATNRRELAKLKGEVVTYSPQLLPPTLIGPWSPTYVLRLNGDSAKTHLPNLKVVVLQYLQLFYRSPGVPQSSDGESVSFTDGSWLLDDRSLTLYPLFIDAMVLRLGLPYTIAKEEQQGILQHLSKLDGHLESLGNPIRVCDVVGHADGMHTEHDEYTLTQYATRSPMAGSLELKVGAQVMLRTNLAPGLVNGTLGRVIGFRRLEVEQLPRYVIGNAQREAAVRLYSDFLQFEQGFEAPMLPEVNFAGRIVIIPPVLQYVGGLHSTHFYSMAIVALPLSLAYAFTVHKVQGLTLVGRVHLELSRMWPCEHLLYVAMSRVRNPEQLSISNFSPQLIRVSADCLLFDDSLPSVSDVELPTHAIPATWRRAPARRKKRLLQQKMDALTTRTMRHLRKAAARGNAAAEIRLIEEKLLRQRKRKQQQEL